MTYRADEMMVRAGRFVDGLKAAGAGFFAGVPVKFPCGCHCTDKGVYCINELYQKGLTLWPPGRGRPLGKGYLK